MEQETNQGDQHLIDELYRMQTENAGLKESLKKIFGYMDSGVLIRDISKDHESDWPIKMLRFQIDLKEAYDKIK